MADLAVTQAQRTGRIATSQEARRRGMRVYDAVFAGLTRTAALELGPQGVRVNSVHPGAVDTPMVNPDGADMDAGGLSNDVPAQRTGRAEEGARASLYLASDEASYCYGTELVVDGGVLAGRYYPFLPGAPAALMAQGASKET